MDTVTGQHGYTFCISETVCENLECRDRALNAKKLDLLLTFMHKKGSAFLDGRLYNIFLSLETAHPNEDVIDYQLHLLICIYKWVECEVGEVTIFESDYEVPAECNRVIRRYDSRERIFERYLSTRVWKRIE